MADTVAAKRKYHLGAVKPWVQSAADYLGNLFGFTDIGGYREHGSVKNSDHPKGLALDFMTNDSRKGNELLQYGIAHYKELGIRYLIYNRKIYQAKNGFQPEDYTGPSPHTDHVHISFEDSAPSGGTVTTPVVGGVTGVFDTSQWPVIGDLEKAAERLTSRDFWIRAGLYMAGLLLVVAGLLFLFREPIADSVAVAAKIKSGGL